MIAQLSVGNFLSFKGIQVISFEPSVLKDTRENVYSNPKNPSIRLLKSISIYGCNSSGKSNLLKAFTFMKYWVINSFNESNRILEIPLMPYLLTDGQEKKNSFFEVIFYVDEIRYRYGFRLTKESIDEEWLFYSEPKKREQHYFIRKEQTISFNSYWKKNSPVKIDPIVTYVKPMVLFISVLGQFNVDVGKLIITWFNKNLIAFDLSSDYFINKAASLLKDTEYFIAIHHLIEQAKLGFKTIEYDAIGKYKNDKLSTDFISFALQEELNDYKIQTKHEVFNETNKKVGSIFFDLKNQESAGTQKFFALAGALLSVIKNSQILWVDELDGKFHPLLFHTIVRFFNSNKFNHRGAQLIFTTHNTHLLKDKVLRRDQVFSIEKDERGESKIIGAYSANVRMDISYEKQYFDNKFGGIKKIDLTDTQLDLF
jgi:uncharacterized protein